MHKGEILLVEDDRSTVILIKDTLEREKYILQVANNLQKAKNELEMSIPDLIILDRRLPDGDGIDFCREIRSYKRTENVPILFLTAINGVSDKIVGLRVGGDDYLTKPFNIEELIARIDAMLRRIKKITEPSSKVLKARGIELDITRHECKVDGGLIELWPKEFELLKVFLEHKNRIISKEFLSEHVWNYEYSTTSRTIEITVQRLRKKLGKRGNLIETIKTYGYKLTL